jgi:hypothetical protein
MDAVARWLSSGCPRLAGSNSPPLAGAQCTDPEELIRTHVVDSGGLGAEGKMANEAGACQTRNVGSYEDEEKEEKEVAPLDEVRRAEHVKELCGNSRRKWVPRETLRC